MRGGGHMLGPVTMIEPAATPPPADGRWAALAAIAAVQVLAMSVWFSASAAVPALRVEWGVSTGQAAWLTGLVQLGFVLGAVGSAVLNLADRVPARTLIALCAAGAATTNALVVVVDAYAPALPLRLLTGVFLAGVYPVGMKLMATWFIRGRGLAIGTVVGALTLGSGSPHLVSALGGADWRLVLLTGSVLALLAALAILPVRDGPFATPAPPLDLRWAVNVGRQRPLRLATAGYLGHMWELYALWAWLPAYLAAALGSGAGTSVLAFGAIGVAGLVGAVGAGLIADRVGRTATTIVAMAVSGLCAAASPLAFAAPAAVLGVVVVIWGAAVIADSAQFSTAISELADRRYVGTALTVQTAAGFLLTIVAIRLIGGLGDALGWQWAFVVLAPGPALGVLAMALLRRDPAATRMAGGAR